MKLIFKLLIRFYQRFISPLKPASCRYYPSCSEYGIWQFENNTFFKAIYFTITRVLRCNQLYEGGFDYPQIKLVRHNNILYKKIKVKYWLIPTHNNKYFVVKNQGVKTT